MRDTPEISPAESSSWHSPTWSLILASCSEPARCPCRFVIRARWSQLRWGVTDEIHWNNQGRFTHLQHLTTTWTEINHPYLMGTHLLLVAKSEIACLNYLYMDLCLLVYHLISKNCVYIYIYGSCWITYNTYTATQSTSNQPAINHIFPFVSYSHNQQRLTAVISWNHRPASWELSTTGPGNVYVLQGALFSSLLSPSRFLAVEVVVAIIRWWMVVDKLINSG